MSAEVGLTANGHVFDGVPSQDGQTFYRRFVPLAGNDQVFYALFANTATLDPKGYIDDLLAHSGDKPQVKAEQAGCDFYASGKAYGEALFGETPQYQLLNVLAALQQHNLVVYTLRDGILTPAHIYHGDQEHWPTLHLEVDHEAQQLHVLEQSRERLVAQEIQHQELKNIKKRTKIVANVPYGSAMGLVKEAQKMPDLWDRVQEKYAAQQSNQARHPFEEQFLNDDQKAAAQRRFELLKSITEALTKEGATSEEIKAIVNSPDLNRLVNRSVGYNPESKPSEQEKPSAGRPLTVKITQGTIDPLERALGLMNDGAGVISDFANDHPHLASLSITAIKLTLSGPVGFAREQVLDVVGINDSIDKVATKAENYFSEVLQDQLGFDESYANLTAGGARFGAVIGLGIVGAASKDKIIDTAKDVAEKVKKVHKNSLEYIGPTHVYKITNSKGEYKIGESAQGINGIGQSKRAEMQARKLRKETGEDHKTQVLAVLPGKQEARRVETSLITSIREEKGTNALPGNKGLH